MGKVKPVDEIRRPELENQKWKTKVCDCDPRRQKRDHIIEQPKSST